MTNRGADGAYGSAATVQGCVSFGTLPVDVFLISRVGKHMPKLSNNAIEIKAKMKALKRWLLDFTDLDEAVPQDVVLWNRLLVMAVVLGVSDQVIEKLGVVAPDVVTDPDFLPTYVWCGMGYGTPAPATSMRFSLNAAFTVASSGSGSGGGFSGGGGGGGGAFQQPWMMR